VRDKDWFEALYREHHAAVLSYARRRGVEPDDLVAEVFATAWRSRDRVPDAPLPWLLRTARNHLLHEARSQARRARLVGRVRARVEVEGDHADVVAERRDAETAIAAALARLSVADQEVLRLAAWEQLDTPALAYVLECSEVAARVRLHRATRRLRLLMTVPARPDAAPAPVPSDDFPRPSPAFLVPKVPFSDNFPR
jgi:RNA polymerase sigma-70 factor (ECF subfamily)